MILVRHAKPVVNPDTPPTEWRLSDAGLGDAEQLGRRLVLPARSTVVASTERKAIETATALSRGPVATSDAFCEVRRPWYGEPGALQGHVAAWFAGETIEGWERRADAASRFARGVAERDADNLIVVTHGTVMTAWLASVGLIDDGFAFWSDLRMPDAFEVGVLTGPRTVVRCP